MKFVFFVLCLLMSVSAVGVEKKPLAVKVFIAGMFEIGGNQGDKAGEFQHWFERYFVGTAPITVKGALSPVFCNQDGVCGSVLGMGKVASSSSMQAIVLNHQFDFNLSYFIVSGVGGVPPSQGTIADVNWGSWLIDYDLGHRWMPDEGIAGEPVFMPRQGYEDIRRYQLNSRLVDLAVGLSKDVQLQDSAEAQAYRMRYPQPQARRKPTVTVGTHIAGDTFFHGPGLSAQAQYISQLYGADDYMIAEMEGVAIAQVLSRTVGIDRLLSLRGAVNFDQGNPNETTLAHLDPAPGETAGGFAETVENIALVGEKVVDYLVENWADFKDGVPAH